MSSGGTKPRFDMPIKPTTKGMKNTDENNHLGGE